MDCLKTDVKTGCPEKGTSFIEFLVGITLKIQFKGYLPDTIFLITSKMGKLN